MKHFAVSNTRPIIWVGLTITLLFNAVAAVFMGLMASPTDLAEFVTALFYLLLGVVLAVVAVPILLRQPHNPVGWLILLAGFFISLQTVSLSYYSLAWTRHDGRLPGTIAAAWFSQWTWIPPYVIFALVLLLFPTGKLLSPHWRLLAAVLLAWGLLMVMLLGFSPLMIAGPLGRDLALPNPIGLWNLTGQQTEVIYGFLWRMLFLLILLSAISIALRWRRAGGVERQQIKYFLYAVVLIVSVIIIGQFIPGRWFNIINNLAFLMLPVAFGLAILRYRLYDIDVVIRKTLIYSVITGLLTLVYFSSVILLQQLFAGITSEQPTIVVLSTLLIAALFTPLRRWVQNVIDRRFFRKRYDAQRVLASFSQTVRNETDPERLTAELLRVVQETMQPATIRIWIRPESRRDTTLSSEGFRNV